MTNIYWMYDNKLETADRLQPLYAVLSGGTADLYDFDLDTQYKGTCIRGTHYINVYFDGTGIHCDTAVMVSDQNMVGTFWLAWGTTLAGAWSNTHCAIDSSGTTILTWAGTLVYVKIFSLQWRLGIRNDMTANEIFLGRRLELNSNPIYPVRESERKSVTIGETTKGIRHSRHNFDRKSWNLDYEGITDTDKDSIEGMLDYCCGSYKPLWFTLNPSTPTQTYFVRFATDRFDFDEIISGVHAVNIPLEQEL